MAKKRTVRKTTGRPSRARRATQKPSQPKVSWRKGFQRVEKAEASDVYAELRKVMKHYKHDSVEQASAEEALEWAEQHPKGALYAVVGEDWDDKKAAHGYRVEIMRYTIRSVVVKYKEMPDVEQRAFHVDDSSWKPRQGHKPYRDTRDIMKDPDARARLIQRAMNALISFQRQYRHLQEFAVVIRAIDEVQETIKL